MDSIRSKINIPYQFTTHYDKFLEKWIIIVDTSLNSVSIPFIAKIKKYGIIKFTKKEYV